MIDGVSSVGVWCDTSDLLILLDVHSWGMPQSMPLLTSEAAAALTLKSQPMNFT